MVYFPSIRYVIRGSTGFVGKPPLICRDTFFVFPYTIIFSIDILNYIKYIIKMKRYAMGYVFISLFQAQFYDIIHNYSIYKQGYKVYNKGGRDIDR